VRVLDELFSTWLLGALVAGAVYALARLLGLGVTAAFWVALGVAVVVMSLYLFASFVRDDAAVRARSKEREARYDLAHPPAKRRSGLSRRYRRGH
jgi:hypothetical protein